MKIERIKAALSNAIAILEPVFNPLSILAMQQEVEKALKDKGKSMKTLKPKGEYVEYRPLGSSKLVKYWKGERGHYEKGDVIQVASLLLTVIDVTPNGLIIDYQRTDEA